MAVVLVEAGVDAGALTPASPGNSALHFRRQASHEIRFSSAGVLPGKVELARDARVSRVVGIQAIPEKLNRLSWYAFLG